MTSSVTLRLEDFIQAVQSQLDNAQAAMALKARNANLPLTFAIKDINLDLRAHVVATIRPDTVFMPYHWPGEQSANRLTVRAYDPEAKIPEFKVCAVRVERLDDALETAREDAP